MPLMIAAFTAAWGTTAVHAQSGGHFICLDHPPPVDVAGCEVKAWAQQNDDGVLRVELAAGGGGRLDQCRRPQRIIADASEGPEFVDCNGGATYGWYSQRYDCYFIQNRAAQSKDPLDGDVIYPNGVERGDEGAVYRARCYLQHYIAEAGWTGGAYWFLPPSEEPGPTEDPTVGLIVEALDQLLLRGPTIGTAPPAQGAALVRLPVWLWNETDDRNWGTRTAQASAAGITAQASAVATEIIWDMGDGSPVECDEGVAWARGMDTLNPPCGHTYLRSSRDQPDGRYAITAVTSWEVEWSVNGPSAASGTVTLHPESTTTLQVDEVQVLTGHR
jgi:hypothetical protein